MDGNVKLSFFATAIFLIFSFALIVLVKHRVDEIGYEVTVRGLEAKEISKNMNTLREDLVRYLKQAPRHEKNCETYAFAEDLRFAHASVEIDEIGNLNPYCVFMYKDGAEGREKKNLYDVLEEMQGNFFMFRLCRKSNETNCERYLGF